MKMTYFVVASGAVTSARLNVITVPVLLRIRRQRVDPVPDTSPIQPPAHRSVSQVAPLSVRVPVVPAVAVPE